MDYTIKELPESERPREKLEERSASELSEVELLSIILRTGTKGKNVKELSAEILEEHSVSELGSRELEELKKFDGISRVKAGQLKALGELARRMEREESEKIEDLGDLRGQVQDMKYLESEVLRVFCLSSGNEVVDEEELEGGVDSVELDTRRVFRPALISNAAAVVLAHNHPSGDPEPTEADIQTTRELIEAGSSLGIDVLDHVVVGDSVSSMRRRPELDF
ncbi:MAG: DNA repair protein RadC [Candidatus Nanohaloarchaea archaeon]